MESCGLIIKSKLLTLQTWRIKKKCRRKVKLKCTAKLLYLNCILWKCVKLNCFLLCPNGQNRYIKLGWVITYWLKLLLRYYTVWKLRNFAVIIFHRIFVKITFSLIDNSFNWKTFVFYQTLCRQDISNIGDLLHKN